MKISLFGNPYLEADSLPIKILAELRKRFPAVQFVIEDPNELDIPEESKWIIIDTVQGLGKVGFVSIDDLTKDSHRCTVHDFDLAMHLSLCRKIKKDLDIKIIGIPMGYDEKKAIDEVEMIVNTGV